MDRLLYLKQRELQHYTLNPYVTKLQTKGGKSLPIKLLESQIVNRLKKFAYEAPGTFYYSIGIIGLNSLFSLRVISVNPFLYHPALNQYRLLTSFFVVSASPLELIKAAFGMYQYQASFEQSLSKKEYDYDEVKPFEISKVSSNFLYSFVLILAGTVVTEQTIFSIVKHHQLYSLFPVVEYSFRWLYAFTTTEQSIRLNEYLSISPIVLPLALVFVDGKFKELVQGFMIALVVAESLGIKKNKRSISEFITLKVKQWYLFLTTE